MDSKKIIYKTENDVAFITLNNPTKLNCIGFQMLNELNEVLIKVERDHEVRVVVFKGAGERAFSTGADLNEFQSLSEENAKKWIQFGNKVFNRIENLNKSTIAYINGYALGGGLELALTCDFRMGNETAIFASPELQHGWLPGWGGMTRLRRLLGEVKSKEVVLLSEKIQADKALEMGLINRIVQSEEDSLFIDMINHLRKIKPTAYNLAKVILMDEFRTTRGADIQFDLLAMQIANRSD